MAVTPTNNPHIGIGIDVVVGVGVDVERVGPRDWFLSADELAATRTKINKLNRRAISKGFTGSVELAAEPDTRSYTPAPGAPPVTVHGFTVTITGTPPSYAGWRFVAAVDKVPARAQRVTRIFDREEPAYFYQVRRLVIGVDGTRWLSTGLEAEPPQLQPGQLLVFGVFEVDPDGDYHLVADHDTAAKAHQLAAALTAGYAATAQPQFQLPDLPAEAVLRYPPGVEPVIENNLVRPGECDHCNLSRPRTTTFLVQHVDSGALKQVGRSCLKDFLGHSTLPVFIDTDQVNNEIDKALAGGGQAAADWDLTSVLTYAWAVVETHGWTPASAASSGRDSTRDLVGDVLSEGRKAGDVLASIAGKLAEGQRLAPRIITDLLDRLDGSSGYQANVAVILRAGTVNRAKHLGLAVSAINAWQRLTADTPTEPEPAPQRIIRHAGTVGEPITLTGTITTAISVDGYHYNSPPQQLLVIDAGDTIAKMVTAAGWADDVKLGEQVTITAVVKAHTDYHGIPQTVLTRPKRLPDPAPAGIEGPVLVQPLWETVKPVSPSRFQEAALAAAATPARGLGLGLAR